MPGAQIVIVVYIPCGWNDRGFWHRRKPTESLAVPLRGDGAVLVVEPVVCPITGWYRTEERKNLLPVLRRGRLRRETENLYLLTPFVWLPIRWAHLVWIERGNRQMLAWQVRQAVQRISPNAQVVVSWFYRPEHVDLVGLANEDYVIYECYDQHWGKEDSIWTTGERIKQQEHRLFKKADLVVVTSEALLDEKSELHPNVHLFPNAADAQFFARVQATETVVAESVKSLAHPVLGYLGNVNRHLDIDLLRYLAQTRPEWSLLIAGGEEESLQLASYQEFVNLPNVHFTGWIREEIPNYFKAVDVCLIPFRTDSDFNRYRNPNKLHEYIAMGKPVVSTDIPGVCSHADIIYVARTKEEFVSCIEKALAEDGPEKIAERLRRARENSWEKRAEKMVDIIETSLLERNR